MLSIALFATLALSSSAEPVGTKQYAGLVGFGVFAGQKTIDVGGGETDTMRAVGALLEVGSPYARIVAGVESASTSERVSGFTVDTSITEATAGIRGGIWTPEFGMFGEAGVVSASLSVDANESIGGDVSESGTGTFIGFGATAGSGGAYVGALWRSSWIDVDVSDREVPVGGRHLLLTLGFAL